jgi:hypothetical protein
MGRLFWREAARANTAPGSGVSAFRRLLRSPRVPGRPWPARPVQVLGMPRVLRVTTVQGIAAVGAVAVLAAGGAHTAAGPRLAGDRGPGQADAGTAARVVAAAQAAKAAPLRRIILPDLLVVAPKGLTSIQIAGLDRLAGVRNMITFDGAEIKAGGRRASVIGVDPSQFRSWVPLRTASDQAFWGALSGGGFVASDAATARLRLHKGDNYPLRGRTEQAVTFGGAAQLGVAGIDLLVNMRTSQQLGLVHKVAALISAPGAALSTLTSEVSRLLGPSGEIISLRSQQLPVTRASSSQLPASYLQLFQESAARYCPGLSWTVLAAIGQIESADGTNVGPSSAGALGPMQFLPSTWARWGIDGFGQTGAPDIMNPYDAAPSAARLLCGAGAAEGGTALRSAIFAYNHANWYVNEVLALAAEYAADYR